MMAQHPGNDDTPKNPFEELLRQLGMTNASGDLNELMAKLQQQLGPMAAQFQAMFTGPADGSINWESTKHIARQVVAAQASDPTPSQSQTREIIEAFELTSLWLDEACSLPPLAKPGRAWSRAEWVEATMPTWKTLVEPVITRIAEAMASMPQQLDAAPDAMAMQMKAMLERAAAGMFSVQVGQAVGTLATEVVSASDAGLPLCSEPIMALMPTNVAAMSEGLQQPERDVLLFLAAREAARTRLFADVAWLPTQVLAHVEHYARDISIDASKLREAFDQAHPGSPEEISALAEELDGSIFEPTVTTEQTEVLERLETLLALVEGWVEVVSTQALSPWLPQVAALNETMRRRRASGGPTEKTLATLVGLQLRPARVREAVTLWRAIEDRRGVQARDEVWEHPDMLPTGADLSDPVGYATGDGKAHQKDALDAEIENFFLRHGKSE